MKVLFAVNDDNISNSVITKYQQKYKEIITSKNVYYFKAIIKELQEDKTYDAVVIGEDLEPMSNTNYDAIDKFLFDQLDEISDEATRLNGEETPIIFICSDRRNLGDPILTKLFGIGIYNALVGNDRSINTVCTLLNKPRNKKEAKRYYKIDSGDNVSYTGRESRDEVSENEINNIINYYKKIGNNVKKSVEAFEKLANQYNETQLRIIINYLPIETKSILETNSQKYQKFVTAGTTNSQGQYMPYAQNDPKNPKIDIIEKNIGQTQMNDAVIIPSTMNINNPVTQTSGNSNDVGINYAQPVAPQPMQNPYGQNPMAGQPNPYGANPYGPRPMPMQNPYGQNPMAGQPNPYNQNPYGQGPMPMQNPYGQNSMAGQPNPYNQNPMANQTPVQNQNTQPANNNMNVNVNDNSGVLPMTDVQEDVNNELPMDNIEDTQEDTILPMDNVIDDDILPMDDSINQIDEDDLIDEIDEIDEDIIDETLDDDFVIDDDEIIDDIDEDVADEEIKDDDAAPISDDEDEDKDDDEDELLNNPIVIADDDEEVPTVSKILNSNDDEIDEIEDDDTDDEIPDVSTIVNEPEPETEKRGRGRPRKNPIVEKKVELDENGNPIKRGRGRPKKVQVQEEVEEVKAPVVENTDGTVDEIDEIEDDILDNPININDEDTVVKNASNNTVSEEDFITETEKEILGDLDFVETTPNAQDNNVQDIDEDDYLDDDDELDDILNFDIEQNKKEEEQLQQVQQPQNNTVQNQYVNADQENPYLNKNPYNQAPQASVQNNQAQNNVAYQNVNQNQAINNFVDDYNEETDFDAGDLEMYEGTDLSNNAIPLYGNNGLQNINTGNQLVNQENSEPIGTNFVAGSGKIVSFVGTGKNGTSFIVNNLAQMLSQNGIKTAILDLTKNKNEFYMFTNNDADLMQKATESLGNLSRGDNSGLVVSKNLTIFTALPTDIKESYNYDIMLTTASNNYEVVLLDCDFDTDPTFFVLANEIYLVQSMDVFTIQPLTKFLSELKVKGYLDESKLRIIVNKVVRTKMLNSKVIIGGMSKYNEPSMSLQRDLFNPDVIPFIEIPFEEQNYAKYLESVVMCKLDLNGYTQQFMGKLNELKNMVYPLIAGRSNRINKYNNYANKKGLFGVKKNTTNYSSNMNNTNMNSGMNQNMNHNGGYNPYNPYNQF